jgi:hypothetical protein
VQGKEMYSTYRVLIRKPIEKGIMNVLRLDERRIFRQNLREEDQRVKNELMWLKIGEF